MKHPPGAGESPQALLIKALIDFDKTNRRRSAWRSNRRRNHDVNALRLRIRRRGAQNSKCRSSISPWFPEFGSSCTIPARIGYLRAAELILLGQFFDTRRAAELGLVTQVCARSELARCGNRDGSEAGPRKAPHALQGCKRLMKESTREQLEQAVKLENEEFSVRVRSAEAKEAFTAFLEKRPPKLLPNDGPGDGRLAGTHLKDEHETNSA